ncbi:MAG: penicillin-binding protein activator [Wenzhouxiangella sp.]
MTVRPLLALLCLLTLAACAPEPLVRSSDSGGQASGEIEALIEDGDYQRALEVLQGRLPGLDDTARAGLQLRSAEQFLAVRRSLEARRLLDELRPNDLRGFDGLRLTLARAELALLDRDPDTAAWLLDQIEDQLPASLRARHQTLRQRLGQPLEDSTSEVLKALHAELGGVSGDPELALAALIEFPLARLEALLADPDQPPELLPWLDLAATARSALLDPPLLEPLLEAWQARHPEAGYTAADASQWLAAWRQLQLPPARVALILPGAGSNLARPGRVLRDGMLSRWLQLSPERRPELRFFYIDDAPDAAIAAWYAARDADADQVVGPLQRQQVEHLVELGDASVPVLFLNHPARVDGLNDFPGLAAAYALTPEEEAELVASRALLDGHRRALVLRQDSDWGRRVADAFSAIFQAGDGIILRDMSYPPDQVDHSIRLEVLLELDRSRARGEDLAAMLGTPLEFEPARRTDADLIFLAARADDARALRPQLRFFGAGDLAVMATSHVLAGAPDPRRDQDLDGVVLPVAPWFLDNGPAGNERRRAANRYPDLDNPTLSRLFALGGDAFDLLPWLDQMRNDPDLYLAGLTGRLRLTERDLIERDLPFVRIVDGQAVPE